MPKIAIVLSILTFFSTYFGGLFSIRFKNKLHFIMAFTAGVLLGIVCFDLLPEIIELIRIYDFKSINAMIAMVVGFLLFHIFEKTILIHHAHECDYASHKHPKVGVLGAMALIGHSFMDGIGIGLGFQINESVGLIVAIAIIAHDFTDGMNTVSLMLTNKNTLKKAKLFLIFDAIAPILGAVSTIFFHLSPEYLVLYLGFFTGFLMYIGASDILPEAHSEKSSYKLIGLTITGVVFIYFVIAYTNIG